MVVLSEQSRVMGAGIASLLLTIGIARFAYTPLLPIMQSQTGLGLAEGGWLASGIYLGYLCGAFIAASVKSLATKDLFYRIGLLLAVISSAGMAITENFWLWMFFRFLAGLSGTAGMLLASALILNWRTNRQLRPELGVHFSGVGIGVVFTALLVEVVGDLFDWRQQWLLLTVISVVLAFIAWIWLPKPDDNAKAKQATAQDSPPSPGFFRLFLVAYFCAGIGYVVSITFIVAIIEELPGLQGLGSWAFMIMGVAAAPACILWDIVARHIGYVMTLIWVSVIHVVGILLPVLIPTFTFAFIGCALFGATFIALVSLVLTMSGRYFPSRPAKMMGKMTVAYGFAVILGPAVTGLLAEKTGSYASGLYFAAAVMSLGCVLFIGLKLLERKEQLVATT